MYEYLTSDTPVTFVGRSCYIITSSLLEVKGIFHTRVLNFVSLILSLVEKSLLTHSVTSYQRLSFEVHSTKHQICYLSLFKNTDMDSPTLIRTAHLLGISSSFFLSGFAFAASFYTLPALSHSPLPARLLGWLEVYDLGKLISPTIAAASAVFWGYLTYASYSMKAGGLVRSSWQSYLAAGLLTFAILPWTLVVMMPANKTLMKAAWKVQIDGAEAIKLQDHAKLEETIGLWGTMNWFRAVTPMVGGMIGVWGIL